MIVLLRIFSRFWQWNNFENRLLFYEVTATKKTVPVFGPPCIVVAMIERETDCQCLCCVDKRDLLTSHLELVKSVVTRSGELGQHVILLPMKHKKLIRRWDSERQLSLRRLCTRTKNTIDSCINSATDRFLQRMLTKLYTSLFTIMVANEKKTEKQTEQKLN